ncbi:hypothetical protein F2P81_019051 [Scophthalmus maximus]|uniref:Uncharacterized protein n=1 Tax=Scophthalmus maximus TaxID=52904 RepID=A0A6A4S404_SCOMX|nr:hypothetical protein F2P81_019051 [Scophthalmus maximus]
MRLLLSNEIQKRKRKKSDGSFGGRLRVLKTQIQTRRKSSLGPDAESELLAAADRLHSLRRRLTDCDRAAAAAAVHTPHRRLHFRARPSKIKEISSAAGGERGSLQAKRTHKTR